MARKMIKRFEVTYFNADDNSFAERIHFGKKIEAITEAKVFILLQHLRYKRDLNCEIRNELHPKDEPIVVKLNELLIKPRHGK
jgi:hypothetical protein